MLPQNAHQLRSQHQHQPAVPFMSQSQSVDPSYFNLDPSQAAKQMAALSAASQARIATNSRGPQPALSSPVSGTSSAPYLGGINSPSYPAANPDLLTSPANPHANFQIPNTHPMSPAPPHSPANSFMDPTIAQQGPVRNPPHNPAGLKQRQQTFLHHLANFMAKRGIPLPPALTGVPTPSYDPANSHWSIIEPSTEVGAFRLAGRDVDLFKLWGLVVQQGGGSASTNSFWASILPHFDLPESFPQPQPSGNTSVALALAQHYMYILFPFEEVYRRNLDNQKKAQMISAGRPGMPSQQTQVPGPGRAQISVNGSQPVPNQMQRAAMTGNPMMNPALAGVHGSLNGSTSFLQSHTPQPPHQRPSSTLNPHQPISSSSITGMSVSESLPSNQRSLVNIPDNMLDSDLQGIKRKLDMDEGDSKRVRQKTEPLDSNIPSNQNEPPMTSGIPAGRPRAQPSRRKIEYLPIAREVDTFGGRDLKLIDQEWSTSIHRRPLRDINDWGTIDIEALTMSIRSRLSTELSYALTTFSLLSTMRGQTQGSGFPISQCSDLLDEILDLVEDEAFGSPDDVEDVQAYDNEKLITNHELVRLVHEEGTEPFAALFHRNEQWSSGPRQPPSTIILSVLNIIRNLSIIPDNGEFLARHERLIDVLLRLCLVKRSNGGRPTPVSSTLSLSDLIAVRKDTLYTLTSIAGHIQFTSSPSSVTYVARIAKRTYNLVASYLVDRLESVSPLICIQVAGVPLNANARPPALADVALELFTRFSQSDSNRQVLAKTIAQDSLWSLFESLIHRLPILDADFQVVRADVWLSYLEKIIMGIYSIAFLAPPELKHKVKANRTLGFQFVMTRMLQKFLMNRESRNWFSICIKRSVEAMKVLDDAADSFDTSDIAMPVLSFGMGFGEIGDSGVEKGTGLLGGYQDIAWHMLMVHEVQEDAIMFGELESLARVDCS
ncbi:hypothetical protein BDQ17DRAFT_1340827 [Cyathus striatus]|nr:hypothetical protein BDQ17DRAFT_1340827 [Cyathus striatus]